MQLFLLTLFLISVAFIALGIRIFFHRERKFPETEVGRNKHMRKLGLTCPNEEDKGYRKSRKKILIDLRTLKIDTNKA